MLTFPKQGFFGGGALWLPFEQSCCAFPCSRLSCRVDEGHLADVQQIGVVVVAEPLQAVAYGHGGVAAEVLQRQCLLCLAVQRLKTNAVEHAETAYSLNYDTVVLQLSDLPDFGCRQSVAGRIVHDSSISGGKGGMGFRCAQARGITSKRSGGRCLAPGGYEKQKSKDQSLQTYGERIVSWREWLCRKERHE